MLQKKICMVGAAGVGKTSLVRRFVEGLFTERYHSTLGVKVDKKVVRVEARELALILWDLAGMDELSTVPASYLRGASGYLLVADGTRPATIEAAVRLGRGVREVIGDVPYVVVLNKSDLVDDWADGAAAELKALGTPLVGTSAKTGSQVETAFRELAARMLPA